MCSDACLSKALCGANVDEVFSYSTPVVVRIRDRRLGLLRIVFSVLIFAYIGIYNIWYQRGYAKQGTLLGNSRITFQAPTRNTSSGASACDPWLPSCEYDFGSPTELAYCTQSQLNYTHGRKFPCSNLTEVDLVSGLGNGGEYFLATKQQGIYTRSGYEAHTLPHFCAAKHDDFNTKDRCSPYAYAVQPERFTMLFDHGFSSEELNIYGSSRTMKGRLRVSNKALCDSTPVASSSNLDEAGKMYSPWNGAYCLVNPNKTATCESKRKTNPDSIQTIECGYDVLNIDYVLDAVSRENPRLDDPVVKGKSKTHRDQGMVLDVRVIYSNVDQPYQIGVKLLPGNPYYELEFVTFPNQNAKWSVSSDQLIDGSPFQLLKYQKVSAGLDLHVRFIDDQVLKFDAATLLSSVTSAITLIFVATKIVDFYMLSPLSKFRNYYKRLKFHESINFTQLADFLEDNAATSDLELNADDLRGSLDEATLSRRTGLSSRSRDSATAVGAEPNVSLFRWRIRPDGQREFVQIEIPERVLEEHGTEQATHAPKRKAAEKVDSVAQERQNPLNSK